MFKKILFLTAALFYLGNTAFAEGWTGYDLLALQHPNFPVEKVLSEIPSGSSLGLLLDTFGDDRTVISRALESGKFTSFRIHLANGPGLRNQQLGSYENLSGLNIRSFERKILTGDSEIANSFIERAIFVNELTNKFPNIKCFVSPVLEHNLSPDAFSKLAKVIGKIAPTCQIINNPVNGWKYQLSQDQFLEVHGMEEPPASQYIASQDGDFGPEENFLNFHNKAFIRFIWRSGFNCRVPGKFIDPRQRNQCG